MKKNLVALLLVLAVVSVGLFAGLEDTKAFDIRTTVSSQHHMKFTTIRVANYGEFNNGSNNADLSGGVEFTAGGPFKTDGTFATVAYISTASNHRAGYYVKMTAKAMKHTDVTLPNNYINYTIVLDRGEGGGAEKTATTNNATDGVIAKAIEVTSQSGMQVQSKKIEVKIDTDSYTAAADGLHEGTVTFEYYSN